MPFLLQFFVLPPLKTSGLHLHGERYAKSKWGPGRHAMKVLLVTLSSVLVQLGLAIFGWGGFAAFFSHPPLVAMTVATLVMTFTALFSGGNLSSGEREDRGNRWVLGAFSVLAMLLAYIPKYTDRNNLWTIDGDATRWTGFVVFVIGGALRLWPVFVLGRRFSGPRRYPKGPQAGNDRNLSLRPQSKLSWFACRLTRLGPHVSCGTGRFSSQLACSYLCWRASDQRNGCLSAFLARNPTAIGHGRSGCSSASMNSRISY
jgi:hypothetical protein